MKIEALGVQQVFGEIVMPIQSNVPVGSMSGVSILAITPGLGILATEMVKQGAYVPTVVEFDSKYRSLYRKSLGSGVQVYDDVEAYAIALEEGFVSSVPIDMVVFTPRKRTPALFPFMGAKVDSKVNVAEVSVVMYSHVIRIVKWLNAKQKEKVQTVVMIQVQAKGVVHEAGTDFGREIQKEGYNVSELELNPALYGDATARRVRLIMGVMGVMELKIPSPVCVTTSIREAIGEISGKGFPMARATFTVGKIRVDGGIENSDEEKSRKSVKDDSDRSSGSGVDLDIPIETSTSTDTAIETSPNFATSIEWDINNMEVRAVESHKVEWQVVNVAESPLTGSLVVGQYYAKDDVYPKGKRRCVFDERFPLGAVTRIELPLVKFQRGGGSEVQ